MLARIYLRASTAGQDASRAKEALERFARDHGLVIAATYAENESGTRLARPELFRLLEDSLAGDILLTEQVDRISRLNRTDWEKLKAQIAAKGVRIVALDLPTSWMFADVDVDGFSSRMFAAINEMMLDMLSAIARKDYDDRLRRQLEGQAKARAAGRYKGRPENTKRNDAISAMLIRGASWTTVQRATGCSRATVAKLSQRLKASAEATEGPSDAPAI